MSGTVWSKVIDGVTVTVDVEATRAAYEQCAVGLECKCGACRHLSQHIHELLSEEQRASLHELGADPLKPYNCDWSQEAERLTMVELNYELVGTIEPDTHAHIATGVLITGLRADPRRVFATEGSIQIGIMLRRERLPTGEVPP
jgi:hypothetical protein